MAMAEMRPQCLSLIDSSNTYSHVIYTPFISPSVLIYTHPCTHAHAPSVSTVLGTETRALSMISKHSKLHPNLYSILGR